MLTETQTQHGKAARILDWVCKSLVPSQLPAKQAARSKRPQARAGAESSGTECSLATSDAMHDLQAKLRAAEIDATASMVQMVQLSDVRKELSDQWPKVAETAMSVAETLLRHRLDQSDVFSRYMDYGFVVVFTRLKPEAAVLRAEALSQEISQLLLKKPEIEELFGVGSMSPAALDLAWRARARGVEEFM